jgi:tRNA U55 pseudouridine synthase TruB
MEKTDGGFDVKNAISGVLVVDKPVGLTSHDVVLLTRELLGFWLF